MTPDRWHQVDHLFQAVIDLSPEERIAYLDSQCHADRSLRREVESLISYDEQGLSLIDGPALEFAASLLVDNPQALEPDLEFGDYKILELIGTGGMGEVYLAMDRTLRRKVALKLLPAEHAGNSEWLRRFLREARAASALNHPNIMTIHEISQTEGLHFIASEFIDGVTLRHRLSPPGLDFTTTLDVAIQVGQALSAAHQEGIVHRDIKPENIMVRGDGLVKVVDFGLANLPERLHASTEMDSPESEGQVMGTPKYMSPEQTQGLPEDPRSDMFSFGVVLYEMIEGHPPFTGDTTASLIRSIREDGPSPVRQCPSRILGEMQRIIEKLLQKDKTKRYPTMRDCVSDLGAVRIRLTSETESSRPISRRMGLVAIAASLLAFLGISIFLASSSNRLLRPSANALSVRRIPNAEQSFAGVISPDGKSVARLAEDAGEKSLLIMDLASGRESQIVSPADPVWPQDFVDFKMTFSHDGHYLYFVPIAAAESVLYRVSIKGGPAERILMGIDSPVSFSPTDREFTFVRQVSSTEASLMIASSDGSRVRVLMTRKSPESISTDGPAWSPDGRVIAASIVNADKLASIVAVRVTDGSESAFSPGKWQFVTRMAWLHDGSGIVMSAAEQRNSHVWFVSYPSGDAHPLVDDLNNYEDITLSDDSSILMARQWRRIAAFWVVPIDSPNEAMKVYEGQSDELRTVAWSPDGRIVYPSNTTTSNRDLWVMNGNGSRRNPLTKRAGLTETLFPAVSHDGRFIAFSADWEKEGTYNLWRIKMDGSDPMQLTHGDGELRPSWANNSDWIYYTHGKPDESNRQLRSIWKVPANGGTPIQVTSVPSYGAVVSRDGKFVAAWYKASPTTPWRVAIIPSEGGDPVRLLNIKSDQRLLRWTPDGTAISFVNNSNGASNIWSQNLEGGAPQQRTHFTSESIEEFDWSSDGRLVCTRAHNESALVTIHNFLVKNSQ